jgi:ubiquinone/menaquinone biosynthesis C-methylase UbiE
VALLNDLTAHYSFAEGWAYDRFIAPAVMDMRDAVVEDYLADLPQGARVLEVGCGGGQLAHAVIEQRPDLRWVGLDASKDQIERARRRNAGQQTAEFVVGDALALPFPDQCFDATVSIASIKHWPDQSKGLAECVRVLRPGGQLLVVEADRGCRFNDARVFVSRWRLPKAMRPLNLALFRTFVAGRSIDLEEARSLMSELPLTSWEVSRIRGTPALLMRGRRLR